jgi:hypothetical protein
MFCRTKAYCIAKRIFLPAAVAAFLALLPMNAAALPVRLPADEDGLAELLEARELDTLQYEQLLVFYALPLSVPQGELVCLAQAFPDIADMFPTVEELKGYRPFDNRQVQKLFNDYPALAGFEPVLRFNEAPAALANGEVVVGINRSSVEALRGHRIRFRRKGAILSAEGAIALNDSAALWQSRRVDVSYRGVDARIGNFKQPVPGELAFGYFAPLRSLMELADDGRMSGTAASWLYGGNGAWNGVSVDVGEVWSVPAVAIGTSAFCHLRPAEAGGGVGADFNFGKRTRAFAGFTGFWLDSNNGEATGTDGGYSSDDFNDIVHTDENVGGSAVANKYFFAHIYAEYMAKNIMAVAETAMPLATKSAAPALSLRLSHRVKGAAAEYRLTAYPANFRAPMSRVQKQLLAEIGEKEPRPPNAQPLPLVQKHAVRMTAPFMDGAVKLIPELDFTQSGGVKRIHGQLEARGRAGMVDITAKHAAKIFTDGADSVLHTTSASVNCQTACRVGFRAAFQSYCGYSKNPRTAYSLETPTTVVPSAVIVPYIRGKRASVNEYWLGIKGEFHLYQKTWTGVTLETPVNMKGAGNVYIKVSSSYSF